MARIIDLSLPIKRHWRWLAGGFHTAEQEQGDHFTHTIMVLNMHGFTHVDAPGHFVAGGAKMEAVPLDLYCGEAALLDLTPVAPEQAITATLLATRGDHLLRGDIALLRTDWPLANSYESKDFWALAPYLTAEACGWLRERGVKAVGLDFPGDYILRHDVIDRRRRWAKEENTTHQHLLAHGIGLIEYLRNLHLVQRPRVRVFALPLPAVGADGSPVRAVAVED